MSLSMALRAVEYDVGYGDEGLYAGGVVESYDWTHTDHFVIPPQLVGRIFWHVSLGGPDAWAQHIENCANAGFEPMKRALRDQAAWWGAMTTAVTRRDSPEAADFVSISTPNDPALAALLVSAKANALPLRISVRGLIVRTAGDDMTATLVSDFVDGRDAMFSREPVTFMIGDKAPRSDTLSLETPAPAPAAEKRGFLARMFA